MNAHVTSREGVNEFDDGIVIVGGGLAAARTAEQLRRAGYSGRLTIVSDEVHLPYDRPPLSKEVLRSEVDDVASNPASSTTKRTSHFGWGRLPSAWTRENRR